MLSFKNFTNRPESTSIPFDWLTVLMLVLAVGTAAAIAFLVGEFGTFMLLLVPAGFVFVIAVGQPEYALYGFIVIIFTQLTTVLSQVYGLPSPALVVVGLLTVLVGIRIILYKERPAGWASALPIILLYNLTWIASLIHAGDFDAAFSKFSNFAQNSFYALLVVFFVQRRDTLRRVIWVLIAIGLWMGTISAFQHLTGTFTNIYWGFGGIENAVTGGTDQNRSMGPYANPNAYAQVLALLVPLALDRLWNERNVFLRTVAGWTLVALLLTIMFTYSRGGLLSMLFGVAILIFRRRTNILMLVLAGLLGISLLQFLPAAYTERFGALTQFIPSTTPDTTSQLNDMSFRGRLSENTAAWRMFWDHPILGIGLGNFKINYQDYSRDLGLEHRRDQRTPASLYLELLSEQGIVGTAIFAVLMFVIFRGLYFAQKQFEFADFSDEAFMASAYLAGMCGYMFSAINKNSAYPNVFWVMLGIALAIGQVAANSTEQRAAAPQVVKEPVVK